MESNLQEIHSPVFAPMLYLNNLAAAIEFYKKAFDATELRHISNDDGTVHVAEMFIGTAILRMHEESSRSDQLSPETVSATTVILGLLVDDPDVFASKAIAAGAVELSPVQEYDYGYRQGTIKDPFGHHWTIEKNGRVKVNN